MWRKRRSSDERLANGAAGEGQETRREETMVINRGLYIQNETRGQENDEIEIKGEVCSLVLSGKIC